MGDASGASTRELLLSMRARISDLVHSQAFLRLATWLGGSISLAAVGVSLFHAPAALLVTTAAVGGIVAQIVPPGLHF